MLANYADKNIMKRGSYKKRIWIVGTMSLLMMCCSACGSNKDDFQKGSYQANELFEQSVETMVQSSSNLEIHFETDLYQEEESQKIAKQIRQYYEKIEQVGGKLAQPLQIYVVLDSRKSGLKVGEHKIICTMKDIESGEYRRAMVQESFQLKDLWKVIGLEYYLFKEADQAPVINTKDLKKQLENKENQDILNLRPFHFMPFFTDMEDVILAQNTARSLTEYQIMNGSLKEFLSGKYDTERKELWMESIDLKNVELSPIEEMNITIQTNENQKVELIKDQHHFVFEASSWMTSSKEVSSFLVDWTKGFQTIMDSFERDGEEMKTLLEECWEKPFTIVFVDSEEKDNTKDTIYLKKGDDPLYELIGQYLNNLGTTDSWMVNGFACYFSRENEPVWLDQDEKEELVSLLNKEEAYEHLSKTDQKKADQIRDQYERRASSPVTADNFNYWVYFQAEGIAKLEARVQSRKAITELSTSEAFALSQYLVQTFGMDECLGFLNGEETFKEVFRGDLKTVINKFLRSIES